MIIKNIYIHTLWSIRTRIPLFYDYIYRDFLTEILLNKFHNIYIIIMV